MVSASDFQSDGRRVGGSRPGWSLNCCVVSLDKKLCSTLSLFTQEFKWVPATYCLGYPCDGQASHPGGGVAILLVASYRNRTKLRPGEPLRLEVRLYLFFNSHFGTPEGSQQTMGEA